MSCQNKKEGIRTDPHSMAVLGEENHGRLSFSFFLSLSGNAISYSAVEPHTALAFYLPLGCMFLLCFEKY